MRHYVRRPLRWIAAALSLLLLLAAVPARANQQGTIRNPNGGSYVNVRANPSYDANILTRLGLGATVEVTGVTGDWYGVWVNGVVGYVHSDFVSLSGGSGGETANATVSSGPLNLREAPSMRARVITLLPTGVRVRILAAEGTWSQVQFGQTIGYVVTSHLTLDSGNGNGNGNSRPPITTENANATIRTNGSSLNLREWGSASAPVLGSYANGSRIRVLTEGGSWSRVQAANQYGYMSSRYLIMDSGGAYDAVVSNPGANQVLNLRAQPDTGSRSLGQYRNGTGVQLLGVGTQWHRVRVGSAEGYMMAKYVRVNSGATPNKTVSDGSNGYVNLRSGPGYDHGVIMRVPNGSAATVTIPYPTWSQVLVRSGSGYTSGYMLNSFLR